MKDELESVKLCYVNIYHIFGPLIIKKEDKKWSAEEARVVICIELRNIKNYDEINCRLGEVVRRECLGIINARDNNYPSAVQMEKDLLALGEKAILLLDGIDEVADLYNKIEKGKKQTLTPHSELIQNILINNNYRF